MQRLSLYLIGFAAGLAALITASRRARAMRRVPVTQAAEQLRQAWADHHTVA